MSLSELMNHNMHVFYAQLAIQEIWLVTKGFWLTAVD